MNISYGLDGIEVGEIIPKLTTKTFTLIINMFPSAPGNYNVSGDTSVTGEEVSEEPQGNLIASLPKNSSVNLRGSTVRDKVTITVINTFDTAKTFSIGINNSNFSLVDASGNALGTLNIDANSTNNFDIYIQRKSGITFATDKQTANLTFQTSDANSNLGSVSILVDKDETLLDDKPPIISDVNATFVAENGKVNLSFGATDVSGIDHFIIEVVDENNNVVNEFTTTNNNTVFTVTGLANGTYYFRVYGVDIKNNNGKTASTSCTLDEGYCSRSTSNISMKGKNCSMG